MKRKMTAMFLALVLVLALLPTAAVAAEQPVSTWEEMAEKYDKNTAEEWRFLLEDFGAKYANVYDWYCAVESPMVAESDWWLYFSSVGLQHFNNAPTLDHTLTQEEVIQMGLDKLRKTNELMYRYLVDGDVTFEEASQVKPEPVVVPTTPKASSSTPNADALPADTGYYTREQMAEIGKEVLEQWAWMVNNRGVKFGDVYGWYCMNDRGHDAMNHIWFLCCVAPSFWNSPPEGFGGDHYYTEEETTQMALDWVQNDNEFLYRYLTEDDLTFWETMRLAEEAREAARGPEIQWLELDCDSVSFALPVGVLVVRKDKKFNRSEELS